MGEYDDGKSRRPSFQYYPRDWMSCPELRACSAAARGLWADMLCLMHEGGPYGYLTMRTKEGWKDIEPPILARLVGESKPSVIRWLAELETAGVFSRDDQGRIFSRRMIRDESVRQKRADGGAKSLENPNVPQPKTPPPKGTPQSASKDIHKDAPKDPPKDSSKDTPKEGAPRMRARAQSPSSSSSSSSVLKVGSSLKDKPTTTNGAGGRSNFSLDQARAFARQEPGVKNVEGFARDIYESGEADDRIAAYLERAEPEPYKPAPEFDLEARYPHLKRPKGGE